MTNLEYDPLFRLQSTIRYSDQNDTAHTALTWQNHYQDNTRPSTVTEGPAPYYSRNYAAMDEASRQEQNNS